LRHAIFRHVPPRRRIVALLSRSGIVLEQSVEADEILLGGIELGSRGADFGAGRFNLRLRQPDVLDPRARLHEPQLRLGRGPLRLRAVNRQLHVAGIQREHDLSRLHAIAFLHRQREDAAADFRSETRLGRFDVPRDAQSITRRFF